METDFQFSDLEVTTLKFHRELETFNRLSDDWRAKGVFLVRRDFPLLEFTFTAPRLNPPSVAYCIQVDFTNYDTEPLSIRFIDPFTRQRLTRQQIPLNFWQINVPQNYQQGSPLPQLDLLQGRAQDSPFVCIRGVREYHNHPAHTGDSWFLYRTRGEGTLGFILDQLYNYSIDQLQQYEFDFKVQVKYSQTPKVTIV